MRILIDCDGVMGDFVGGVVDALNEESLVAESMGYAARPRYDTTMVTSWEIASCLGVPKKRVYDLASQPGFCAALRPLAGAREGVEALRSFGDVYAVTSPIWSSPYWMHERVGWLKEKMGFDWDHIVFTSSKHILDAAVLIDDKAATIRAWCGHGSPSVSRNGYPYNMPRPGALWSQPWNVNEPVPPGAVRFDNWVDLLEALTGVLKPW